MDENVRPEMDRTEQEKAKFIKRRQIEEQRAAYYEKRAREIEEENRIREKEELIQEELSVMRKKHEQEIEDEKSRTEDASKKSQEAKQRMMNASRQKRRTFPKPRIPRQTASAHQGIASKMQLLELYMVATMMTLMQRNAMTGQNQRNKTSPAMASMQRNASQRAA